LEVFGPVAGNGSEKFKAAPKIFGDRYQKSVLGKLRIAAVYQRAKFRDDTMTFRNLKADIFKTLLPPIDSKPKTILVYSGLQRSR